MIQIIISPAKKMNICEEFPGTATTPVFCRTDRPFISDAKADVI